MRIISETLNKQFSQTISDDNDDSVEGNDVENVLQLLKDNFKETTGNSTRIESLTIFNNCCFRKLQRLFFSGSYHMITTCYLGNLFFHDGDFGCDFHIPSIIIHS